MGRDSFPDCRAKQAFFPMGQETAKQYPAMGKKDNKADKKQGELP
jgi:hypothetical protein